MTIPFSQLPSASAPRRSCRRPFGLRCMTGLWYVGEREQLRRDSSYIEFPSSEDGLGGGRWTTFSVACEQPLASSLGSIRSSHACEAGVSQLGQRVVNRGGLVTGRPSEKGQRETAAAQGGWQFSLPRRRRGGPAAGCAAVSVERSRPCRHPYPLREPGRRVPAAIAARSSIGRGRQRKSTS